MADKLFHHDTHTKLLEEAAQVLELDGKATLAAAVRRAGMLHTGFISRMATAKRQSKAIRRQAAELEKVARTMDEYVTQSRGPWIGAELWSEGWPDTP